MKEKLPLKVVGILGEDKGRGRTRTGVQPGRLLCLPLDVGRNKLKFANLENPIVCQQCPEQKECQGTKFYLIGMYLQTLNILISYSQLIR